MARAIWTGTIGFGLVQIPVSLLLVILRFDDYARDLKKLIEREIKAGDINQVSEGVETKPHRAPGAKVIDLAALLASSLKGGKAAANHDEESPQRKTPSLAKARGGTRRKSSRAHGHRKSA